MFAQSILTACGVAKEAGCLGCLTRRAKADWMRGCQRVGADESVTEKKKNQGLRVGDDVIDGRVSSRSKTRAEDRVNTVTPVPYSRERGPRASAEESKVVARRRNRGVAIERLPPLTILYEYRWMDTLSLTT